MWVIRRHIRALHPDNADAKIVDLSSKGGTHDLSITVEQRLGGVNVVLELTL